MKRGNLIAGGMVSFALLATPAWAVNPPLVFVLEKALALEKKIDKHSIQRQVTRLKAQPQSIRMAQKLSRKSLAQIRAKAIASSMVRLERLRPYASNFQKMKAAVRAYWQRNIHNPSARGLTATIMRHVAPQHRMLVRGPVYSSALDGTRKVRAALAK